MTLCYPGTSRGVKDGVGSPLSDSLPWSAADFSSEKFDLWILQEDNNLKAHLIM